MMLSRMVAVSLFALSADYAAALVGPGVLVHGLRRHAAAGPYRPARTTSGDGTSFLRMSGEAEDKDGVMHRVDARLQVEPMSLTVAYFEHAYASPPAEIIADLLEAALSSVDRPFIVLTETKFSKRHIPVWARYSPRRIM